MKSMHVQFTGIRPLVMANPQTVQISNHYSMESRRLGALLKNARKKQDENKLVELEQVQMRNDWESSAYWDDKENRFFLPDTVILACIRAGAAASKKGKDIERAVIITETQSYIETPISHHSLDVAYQDDAFKLSGPCRIPPKTGALIWKCRCMMPTGWCLAFNVEYDDEIVATKSLEQALELAGRLCGIGGWRPKFGRFTVETA
jgi:hypothetical protein